MKGRILVPLASLAWLACVPGAAAAAESALPRHYHGTTPQGLEITLTGAPDGTPGSVVLGFRVGCRRHAFRHEETIVASPPLYAASRREFALVEVPDAVTGPPRRRAEVEVAVTGRRITPRGRPGSEYWLGTLEVELDVVDPEDDSVVERCRTRRMRWRARREGFGTGTWTMTSDRGDRAGGGETYTTRAFTVRGDARGIEAYAPSGSREMPDWRAGFLPPRGERLRAGSTYVDTGDDDDPTDAALEVSGPSRSCGDGSGTFTVRSVRYDRRGRLRDLDLHFTRRCGTGPGPALRGEITFRSRR